jgi:hypothetical protein
MSIKKFYKIHEGLGIWSVEKIQEAMRIAMTAGKLNFDHWKRTNELKTLTGEWADRRLNWNPDIQTEKITNGDMNITTNSYLFGTVAGSLFANSGRRGNIPKNGPLTVESVSKPKISDSELSELSPIFKGTIMEDLHNSMQDHFGCKIRIRCQNRTVTGNAGSGLYWHNDEPVENRFHIPIWTNPGHVLIFSEKMFEWRSGFNPEEAKEPMDFVGHYVPSDGQIYEFFTKDYMHSVGSVGVGWYQDRGLQTRCHLSFWKAMN